MQDVTSIRTISPAGFLLLLLLLLLPEPAAAQSIDDIAIVVGENSAWTIEAPEGWRLEAAGARAAGLGAAFVPEGTSWSSAESILYGITIPKSRDASTIGEIMRHDSIRTEGRQPGTVVVEAEAIGTIEGIDARVRHCYAADSSTVEAVAYLDGPTAVAVIVLNTRSIASFREALASFARLVDSYEWITSDPNDLARLRNSP